MSSDKPKPKSSKKWGGEVGKARAKEAFHTRPLPDFSTAKNVEVKEVVFIRHGHS